MNTGVLNMVLKVQKQARELRTKQEFNTIALTVKFLPEGPNTGIVAHGIAKLTWLFLYCNAGVRILPDYRPELWTLKLLKNYQGCLSS
jgi:hypothetical protein